MDDKFEPMEPKEWAEITDKQKKQMLTPYHQSIAYGCTDNVRECFVQAIPSLMERGINPNQALVIIQQVADPAFQALKLPKKMAKQVQKKIGDHRYIVISTERDVWTGGEGAPHWKDHPYHPQMVELAKEPEEGKLWVLVLAAGAASVFQLGDKAIEAPSPG